MGAPKLNVEDARLVIQAAASGEGTKVIAARFGVATSTIRDILHGKTKPDLPRPDGLVRRPGKHDRPITVRANGSVVTRDNPDIEWLFDRCIPEPNSGCWLWSGKVNPKGYGTIVTSSGPVMAHRIALEVSSGLRLSSNLMACHRCDVPLCINPAHLFSGTAAENMRDCVEKGRIHRWRGRRSGESNPRAKLDRKKVSEIRALRSMGATQSAIAQKFGVSQGTISNVVSGFTWRSRNDR